MIIARRQNRAAKSGHESITDRRGCVVFARFAFDRFTNSICSNYLAALTTLQQQRQKQQPNKPLNQSLIRQSKCTRIEPSSIRCAFDCVESRRKQEYYLQQMEPTPSIRSRCLVHLDLALDSRFVSSIGAQTAMRPKPIWVVTREDERTVASGDLEFGAGKKNFLLVVRPVGSFESFASSINCRRAICRSVDGPADKLLHNSIARNLVASSVRPNSEPSTWPNSSWSQPKSQSLIEKSRAKRGKISARNSSDSSGAAPSDDWRSFVREASGTLALLSFPAPLPLFAFQRRRLGSRFRFAS